MNLRTWGLVHVWTLTCVRKTPGIISTLPIIYFFFNRFTSICNSNIFFFCCCHFCIWISLYHSFYLHSCITIPFSLNFTWIMNLMTSLLFYSHHSLMLVGQAPIRWWSGSTFSPLKLEVMFGRWALSPSLAFFWKSLWVPPWCSAILRGGGTVPIPFILLSGRWWWLSMTSTAWPALDLRGPSLVWMVCQACSWASTCWGGSTPLRPFATSTWC